MKKSYQDRLKAVAIVLLLASSGGTPALTATLDLYETNGSVTYTQNVDGSVTLEFASRRATVIPGFTAGMVVADVGDPASPFTGDYRAAGVTALSFRVAGSGYLPSSAQVVLEGASGRIWVNDNVAITAVAGEWLTSELSFDREGGGWVRNDEDLDAKWEEDVRSVSLIGLRLAQGGNSAQAYHIANFQLIYGDSGPGSDADLTPLEQALRDRFGVTSVDAVTDEARQETSEGRQGMADFLAILMTYDDDVGQALFTAHVVDVAPSGVTLRWPAIVGWQHTLLRSANLAGQFEPVEGAVDLVAPQTGYMTFIDETVAGNSGPFYYRVRRRRQ